MTTNPQIERMAEAIKNVGYKHVKRQYYYTIERKFNEEAQAAYDASDARFVPMLVEALKRIETERYPPQVFLPMTDKQWHSLKLWCESEGFPLDRLSGNYGRELRAADRAIASEALAQLPEGYRK